MGSGSLVLYNNHFYLLILIKTVRIQTQKIGLMFKHGDFQKVLAPGKHWIWPNETVYVYNRGEWLQNLPCDLTVLLSYSAVAAELEIVEIQDNEIALQYEGKLFQAVIPKGRWAY